MINGLCVDSVLQKIIYCLAKKVTVLEESYKNLKKKQRNWRTIEHMIKTWKDSAQVSTFQKNCGLKPRMTVIRDQPNTWSYIIKKKTTFEITAM